MSTTTIPSMIPAPKPDDDDDVSWALSTAETMWGRGEHADALKWVRRAADAASDAELDDRALEIAKAAAELASLIVRESTVEIAPAAPAPAPAPAPEPTTVSAAPLVPPSSVRPTNPASTPPRPQPGGTPSSRPTAVSAPETDPRPSTRPTATSAAPPRSVPSPRSGNTLRPLASQNQKPAAEPAPSVEPATVPQADRPTATPDTSREVDASMLGERTSPGSPPNLDDGATNLDRLAFTPTTQALRVALVPAPGGARVLRVVPGVALPAGATEAILVLLSPDADFGTILG